MRVIFNSLSPNVEKDDILLSLKTLFNPFSWKKGKYINLLEKRFEEYIGNKSISFLSGRVGLHAIFEALDLKEEDEIILQGFTCNALIIPILDKKLKPVFIDIDENLNINPDRIEDKITDRTKVLITQHTFGMPSDIEKIREICNKYNIFLIEDCAHSLGANVGKIGDASFYSFGRDKIISSVFGGMVTIKNERLFKKVKGIRDKYKYPDLFFIKRQLLHPIITKTFIIPLYRIKIGKYFLVGLQKIGVLSKAVFKIEKEGITSPLFHKRLPNALATLGLLQLSKIERFNKQRERIAKIYNRELHDFRRTKLQDGRVYMRYSIFLKKNILDNLRSHNLFLNDGWRHSVIVPPDTNQEKMRYKNTCPYADSISKEILNLPTLIKEKEALRLCKLIKQYGI